MVKKRKAWNKGLTADNDDRVAIISQKLKDGWKNNKYCHVAPKNVEKWKSNISKSRKELLLKNPNLCANYYNRGYVKTYKYKDIILQGTWELRFAIWCDKHNIKWTKNTISFDYIYKGKSHKYFPDFYLQDFDMFVETKGYATERDDAKWSQFPTDKSLLIVDKQYFKLFGIEKVLSLKECTNFLDCKDKESLINHCIVCGKIIDKRSTYCKKCRPNKRKVKRPTKEELEDLIKTNSFVSLDKRFGVSDTAIRKWCKSYGIKLEKYYYQNYISGNNN